MRSRERRAEDLTQEERLVRAETLRERIYATLTLLAVMVVLWQHPEEHQPMGVIGIIAGTVGALWLATLIAARMSYRMVHERTDLEPRYREVVKSAGGLLMPAVLPIVLILLVFVRVMDLQAALFWGMASLLLSLFFFSMYAGYRSTSGFGRVLLFSVMQMSLGVGVVLLKLAVE